MALELEGRRKADGAWYQCQVSIWSEREESVLKVRFKGGDEEYLYTPDEARSSLRPQSKKLENGECRRLLIGETVLAPSRRFDSEASPLHEAQVKKIHRQRHNSGDCCCYVEVSWVEKSNGELSTMPASQIFRVNLCNTIQDHPIIRHWIESRDKQDGDWHDNGDWRDNHDFDSDVDCELDEQIDKIAMMADNLDETYLSPELSSAKSKPRTIRNLRSSERNTRSSSRANASSFVDKRPRLSPLAARAALAATVPAAEVENLVAKDESSKSGKGPTKHVKLPAKKKGCAHQASFRATRSRLAAAASGDLSVDIPMHGNSLKDQAIDLVVEIPLYEV